MMVVHTLAAMEAALELKRQQVLAGLEEALMACLLALQNYLGYLMEQWKL
jgi:hypothetical protein